LGKGEGAKEGEREETGNGRGDDFLFSDDGVDSERLLQGRDLIGGAGDQG